MDLFLQTFVLLLLIAVSNIVHRIFTAIPVPLIQIALGFGAACLPTGMHLTLEPELFFVLFVAPLLFNDGKRTPRGELWRLRAPIMLLAFGLVFATVLAAGYVIHWLIPAVPLSASFALAAILSPTDAVAVGSLSERIRLPRRIMRLLEGEALMNDASGLVAFRFAVAATVTGVFSLPHAAASFVLIAAGGLAAGVVLSFVLIGIRIILRRFGLEDVTVHILIHIMTPFIIYLAAEYAGVSGILAVVAGGIVHAIEKDRTEITTGKMHIAADSIWSVILFILNGLVFLLLGMQLPAIASAIFRDRAFDNSVVVGYIFAITLLLIVLRFFWVYAYWSLSGRKLRGAGRKLHGSLLTSLSGVRGAVTLAGAMSIPHALESGSPFPERELLIFLAAGVILLTLVTAGIMLPLLAGDGGRSEHTVKVKEQAARIKVTEAAIASIREDNGDDGTKAGSVVLADYLRRLQRLRTQSGAVTEGKSFRTQANRIHLHALTTEKAAVLEAFSSGEIDAKAATRLQYWLNQTEMAITRRSMFLIRLLAFVAKRNWGSLSGNGRNEISREDWARIRDIKIRCVEAALSAIKSAGSDGGSEAADFVKAHYEELLERLSSGGKAISKRQAAKINQVQLKAIQAERNEIQRLYERGEINRRIANELLASIHYREATSYETSYE